LRNSFRESTLKMSIFLKIKENEEKVENLRRNDVP
jgi:hypothetical protein